MKKFSNILYVRASDSDNTHAFSHAVEIAKNNQAKLTLIDVVDAVPPVLRVVSTVMSPEQISEIIRETKQEDLTGLIDSIPDAGLDIQAKVLFGKPSIEIIREVITNNIDLVVKPIGKREGLSGQFFGGSDTKLLRKCPCPVYLINTKRDEGPRTILVGLDYEPDNPENEGLNREIMETAISVALANFCELHIVHAWVFEHEDFFRSPRAGLTAEELEEMIQAEENYRRKWLTTFVATYCGAKGEKTFDFLDPQVHLLRGEATQVVPETAARVDADMVILGTVGRTGVSGFIMGNTAEAILHQLDCSVLAIKPPNFVSPVTVDK